MFSLFRKNHYVGFDIGCEVELNELGLRFMFDEYMYRLDTDEAIQMLVSSQGVGTVIGFNSSRRYGKMEIYGMNIKWNLKHKGRCYSFFEQFRYNHVKVIDKK